MDDDQLLLPAEVAELCRIPLSTLTYHRCHNSGPRYIRLGEGVGRVRYRASDVEAWITANTVDPTTPSA